VSGGDRVAGVGRRLGGVAGCMAGCMARGEMSTILLGYYFTWLLFLHGYYFYMVTIFTWLLFLHGYYFTWLLFYMVPRIS
jgi:hypothetical protein